MVKLIFVAAHYQAFYGIYNFENQENYFICMGYIFPFSYFSSWRLRITALVFKYRYMWFWSLELVNFYHKLFYVCHDPVIRDQPSVMMLCSRAGQIGLDNSNRIEESTGSCFRRIERFDLVRLKIEPNWKIEQFFN